MAAVAWRMLGTASCSFHSQVPDTLVAVHAELHQLLEQCLHGKAKHRSEGQWQSLHGVGWVLLHAAFQGQHSQVLDTLVAVHAEVHQLLEQCLHGKAKHRSEEQRQKLHGVKWKVLHAAFQFQLCVVMDMLLAVHAEVDQLLEQRLPRHQAYAEVVLAAVA